MAILFFCIYIDGVIFYMFYKVDNTWKASPCSSELLHKIPKIQMYQFKHFPIDGQLGSDFSILTDMLNIIVIILCRCDYVFSIET